MISQGNVYMGSMPGLELKAWALVRFDGTTPTLLSGFNVASVSGASDLRLNLTVACADNRYVVKCSGAVFDAEVKRGTCTADQVSVLIQGIGGGTYTNWSNFPVIYVEVYR